MAIESTAVTLKLKRARPKLQSKVLLTQDQLEKLMVKTEEIQKVPILKIMVKTNNLVRPREMNQIQILIILAHNLLTQTTYSQQIQQKCKNSLNKCFLNGNGILRSGNRKT